MVSMWRRDWRALPRPAGSLISGSVRDHIGNRLDLAFEDMGEQTLKNIERPIRVYASIWILPLLGHQGQKGPTSRQVEKPAIAVLPFNNMSGDPEQEYFSDGITEDIITDLSKVSGFLVDRPQHSVHLQGQTGKGPQVAQELGVPFILEGSVRKAGRAGAGYCTAHQQRETALTSGPIVMIAI